MTSSPCSCYRERQPKRHLLIILLFVIFRGSPSANGFAGVRSYPKTIRRRACSTSTTGTGSFFLGPSIFTHNTHDTRKQSRNMLQMVASNDNTRYVNDTDTTSSDSHISRHQNTRHEGGTTVDKDLRQLQSRIDEMMAETLWTAQSRGPPNAELGPVEFVQAVLSALEHPDDPFPDHGFRTLIRSSSKKWREQTRKSIGAPPEASEDAIARGLSHAMSRPGSPFALMVDAASDGDCCVHVSFPSDVLDFEDGTAWILCVFHRCEGTCMNKTPILITKWSLVRGESDGAWLIDEILFNNLSKEEQIEEEW